MVSIANRHSTMLLFSEPECFLSHRTRIVLSEKDITSEILDVDLNNKPEELAEVNPYGVLPTLLDRDLVLYDSRIIMDYLDERFPHPPLLPVDPVSRAQCRLALYRVENDWYPLAQAILNFESNADEARKQLTESIASIAPMFDHMPYFMSEEFSLVDVSVAPILWRLDEMGIVLPKQAQAVLDYAERLFAREAFQESLSEAEQNMR